MSRPTLEMTHGAIGEAMCCYTDGSYKDADIALTEYENSIKADELKQFTEWCKVRGYSYYNWRMLIEQYEKENKPG